MQPRLRSDRRDLVVGDHQVRAPSGWAPFQISPTGEMSSWLRRIEGGEIDPSFVITHKRPLADAPEMYKTFRDKKDGCIKVVLKP